MRASEAQSLAEPSPQAGAICVLGMHRSGTSLVTGLLKMCGVVLGPADKMMPPKPDNPSGFWEHRDIHEINERLLAQLGGSWDRPLILSPGWESSAEVEDFYRRARAIVDRDFKTSSCWAWKDPRTAVLLPFWRRVVSEPRFVICVRNPLEVAKSLRLRNGLSVGQATRLWTLYTASALFHTRGDERILTLPENFFCRWREEWRQLHTFLGLSSNAAEKASSELEAFIDREKWHHRSNTAAVFRSEEIPPACKLLYSAILQTTNGWLSPGSGTVMGSYEHLDLLSEMLWQDLVREEQGRRLAAQLDQTRSQAEELRAQRGAELEKLRRLAELAESQNARLASLTELTESQNARLASLTELTETQNARIASLAELTETQGARIEESRVSLSQTRDRLVEQMTLSANLESQLEKSKADQKSQGVEIARLKSRLEESQASFEAVTTSLGWQLLDRYRELRQGLLKGLPERLYRRLVGGFRRRLTTEKTAPSSGRRDPATLFEPVELQVFEQPPALNLPRVEPPRDWCRDRRRPPVVIIIPNWNRLGYLRQCLTSIVEETRYPHYRICVFDQGSNDGSTEYLRSLGDEVTTLASPHNVGFVHANNTAMRSFPQWDVVFLNNDTRVTPGWLENLVETAYSSEKIGLVGAKLLYPDGRLQEAGSQVFRDGSARGFGKFEDQGDPRFNQRKEVDYCSASCLFVKRQVIDACGGFEECYSPCYYEDADLSFKARAAGFKTLYEPSSAVIHQEYGTSGKTSALSWMQRNQERFVERWQAQLEHHAGNLWQSPGSGRTKLLVLGDIVPAPDRSAGGSRLFYLLKILAREYDVVYAFLQDQMIREYVRPLERIGVFTFYPGYARSVGSDELDLKAILVNNSFRFVICSLYTVGAQFLGQIRESSPNSTVLVDTYDLHFLREQRQAGVQADEALVKKARETQQIELATYARADAVIAVTDQDKDALLKHEPGIRVLTVPTLHEVAAQPRPRGERRDLLFVGGFSHEPNTDAVIYFCRDIFPLVREALPEMQLHIVGNSPSPEVLALGEDGIVVWGYVPNLRPYLDSALISIAPIRFGSGMKGKVAEAMAHGLPVVTTTIGAEGMDLEPGVDVMTAETAPEFAQHIISLSQDRELWERIASNAYRRVLEDWTPEAVEPRLLDSLRQLEVSK